MAELRNLMIFGVMLIGVVVGVEGVTDQQFQELSDLVKRMQDENKKQFDDLQLTDDQLKAENANLQLTVGQLKTENADLQLNDDQLKAENAVLSTRVQEQANTIDKLTKQLNEFISSGKSFGLNVETTDLLSDDVAQNTTIEERVAMLEIQVIEFEEEIAILVENDNFLFDEQVIQDERLLNLEERMLNVETETYQIKEDIEGLQVTTLELDFRVSELEENGGSDGNSSISELEERVETLEGTAVDHEAKITNTEGDVQDLEGTSADHETRLTAAEENIQGLQTTDISLDARITALEENGGGGSSNETIAFHAVLTSYSTIPDETNVEFNEILLNEGNSYDSTTGIFTVPPGGDGLYYLSTYLLIQGGEYGRFDMQLNGDVICTAYGDQSVGSDNPQATCSAVVSVVEGDEVKLVLRSSIDDTPLSMATSYYYNGFNGFRI